MSIKEKLSASQSGGTSTFIRLPIERTFNVKENEGTVQFCYYDREKRENVFISGGITGIYIGQAMMLSVFDRTMGNGATYRSAHYTSRDNVLLWKPEGGVATKGTLDTVEAWIASNVRANPRKYCCYFLATSKGLVEVQTNLTIAIDRLKRFGEELKEKYMILNPELYSNDTELSRKSKEYLGKLAAQNPPKYADVSVGKLISEKDFEAWGTEEKINTFIAWKKQQGSSDAPTEEKEKTNYSKTANQLHPNKAVAQDQQWAGNDPMDQSDLPF